ncbi:MAG: hypothetical protein AVDCRST_MAG68-5633 [uncultured Gemmatimonadetes bacterium]|uniref:Uncharacterized protein n=1 Tax=uncultured Gemmatimonadota bacterium TaxID=203437 RepID=A0A6J4MY64_9BACT|nr:MAG: hypothetical protein AVDCRST_MAG68-5633 [uncultured Gemmatimonadota bacterium]
MDMKETSGTLAQRAGPGQTGPFAPRRTSAWPLRRAAGSIAMLVPGGEGAC